jgi:LPXTG-motif cell wall-anchored protein
LTRRTNSDSVQAVTYVILIIIAAVLLGLLFAFRRRQV